MTFHKNLVHTNWKQLSTVAGTKAGPNDCPSERYSAINARARSRASSLRREMQLLWSATW